MNEVPSEKEGNHREYLVKEVCQPYCGDEYDFNEKYSRQVKTGSSSPPPSLL